MHDARSSKGHHTSEGLETREGKQLAEGECGVNHEFHQYPSSKEKGGGAHQATTKVPLSELIECPGGEQAGDPAEG